jgi:hypothetical protein
MLRDEHEAITMLRRGGDDRGGWWAGGGLVGVRTLDMSPRGLPHHGLFLLLVLCHFIRDSA